MLVRQRFGDLGGLRGQNRKKVVPVVREAGGEFAGGGEPRRAKVCRRFRHSCHYLKSAG